MKAARRRLPCLSSERLFRLFCDRAVDLFANRPHIAVTRGDDFFNQRIGRYLSYTACRASLFEEADNSC